MGLPKDLEEAARLFLTYLQLNVEHSVCSQ